MSLGSYESEVGRGNLLSALAHPSAVNPLAAMTAGVQAARGVTDLRTAQFNLQQSQLAPAYQSMRMLAATNPNPSVGDIQAALGGAARIGGNVDGVVQNLSDWTARGGKPGDFVRAYALGGMAPENQAVMGIGVPVAQDTGAGTVYGMRGGTLSGAPGQFTPSSFVQRGLTPGEATEFVTVTGQDGHQYQVPRGTLYGSPYGGGGGSTTGNAPAGAYGKGGPNNAAVPANYLPMFQAASARTGIPVDVLIAQARQESGFRPDVTGAAGEIGIGQILPKTAQNPGFGMRPVDPAALRDPQTNINFMADYLKAHLPPGANPNDPNAIRIALQGYNGGGDPNYVANVTRYLPAGAGGGAQPAGPFIGATSAQPVTGGAAVAPPGGGAGANVQPAGGVQTFSPTGQPIGAGGGGSQLPGVARGPGGAPILTPPAPWMGPLWEQSAKEYSTDVSREAGLASRIQPWQSALSIIKANPNLSTGPTSQQWNNWGTVLSQYGVQLPSMPGDSVAAYQELSKSLHQGLVNSGAFSGTDMARLEAEASSPNMQQQVEAIRELSARQIGYERFQMARLKYFRSLHPGEDTDQVANQYRSQTSTWASNLDPVAFGADNLTPSEIKSYRQGLTPQQDDKFLRSLKAAHSLYPEITPGGQ